jgi:hypothetical protein
MPMKVKSFGCSFIFGTELHDNPSAHVTILPVGKFSRLTWPALISQQLNSEYECHARPGAGNLQIAERVLNECVDYDDCLFIIDWTWIDRFDYIKSQDFWQPWGTIRPGCQESLAELYYKNLHSEYKDKLVTLIYIRSVIDTLLQKRIKFIMTYEDELMFDQHWNINSGMIDLQDYIRPYMNTFDGLTFLNWSQKNKYPVSKNLHPLEQAHQAAADYMIKIFDKKKINDLIQPVHV